MAAHFGDRSGSGVEIGADQVAPLLGIELRGDRGRADQIAEHHREIAAFAGCIRRAAIESASAGVGGAADGCVGSSRDRSGAAAPLLSAAMAFKDFAAVAE